MYHHYCDLLLHLSEDFIFFYVFTDFGFLKFIPHTASPLVYMLTLIQLISPTEANEVRATHAVLCKDQVTVKIITIFIKETWLGKI
jgi:hypothetical protein